MSDITYSWNEYIRLNEELVYKVAKSGWQFDCLICLSRGGMRPGDFFSRIYGKPLAVLATSSYLEAKGTVQAISNIADCMTGLAELKGKVLLVDGYGRFRQDDSGSGGAPEEALSGHHGNPRGCSLVEGALRS